MLLTGSHLRVGDGSASGRCLTQSPRRDCLESFVEKRQQRDRAVRGCGLVGALARLEYHHAVGVFPFRGVGGRREEVREDPGEDVREAGMKAAYSLVAYLIRADCGAVIQAGNDVVDFGARYRMKFVAEVSLARDVVRGENFGGIVSRREKRRSEGVAFLLEVFGAVDWRYWAAMGIVMLDCPPDVAMVGLGKSARVVVVPGMCNHAAPLLIQGMEASACLRTGVTDVADAALSAFYPDTHPFQFRVPPRHPWFIPACSQRHRGIDCIRDILRDGRDRTRRVQVVEVQASDMVVEEAPIGIAPVPVLDGIRSRGGAYIQVEGNGAVVGGGGFVIGPRRNAVPYGATTEREVYHGWRCLAIS
jgi:hypothetical protein